MALPPHLCCQVAFFGVLLAVDRRNPEAAQRIGRWFKPAVEFYGKWMPFSMIPPLLDFPLAARGIKDSPTLVFGVHFIGFLVTCASTALVAHKVNQYCTKIAPAEATIDKVSYIHKIKALHTFLNFFHFASGFCVRRLLYTSSEPE